MESPHIFDNLDFTEEDLKAARMEYFSKTGDVPPVEITEEIAKMATQIHIDKFIENVQKKRKIEIPNELSDKPKFEAPPIITPKEKTYDSTFKLQIPKSPKKEMVEDDIPIEVSEDEELEVDYTELKNNSVGKLKNAKTVVKVIVDLALVAGIAIAGISLDTRIKEKKGLEPSFNISEYEGIEWHGSHYETWYEFYDIGSEIVGKALENSENSELSFDESLLMIFGEEIRQVIENRNFYGISSHYSIYAAVTEEGKGWAQSMYEGIYDNAKEKGIELPNNLVSYLALQNLTNCKYSFNDINGNLNIKALSELDEEDRQVYGSFTGAMLNCQEVSKHYSYLNSLSPKGVGR